MKTDTASTFFFLIASLLSGTAAAGDCANVFVGDYATEEHRPAEVRIENLNGKIVSRYRNADGRWATHFDEAYLLLQPELMKFFDNAPLAEKSCGLGVVGVGTFLKLPVGTPYKASSATEKSLITKHVKTGFLAYSAQGFSISALDLYVVPHKGESPPAPPPPPKAVVGKEVPLAPSCPGERLPDMTQADFNALPGTFRKWYHSQNAESQRLFTCGQYLDGLMRNDHKNGEYNYAFEELGTKYDQLEALLATKQVPRSSEGKSTWRSAAWFLLSRNHERGYPQGIGEPLVDTRIPRLFDQKILPHVELTKSSDDDDSLRSLLQEALYLPDDIGLRALKRLNEAGFLRKEHTGDDEPNEATRLLEASDISSAKFEYLLAEAGPSAINNPELMRAKIDDKDVEGAKRLISAGANPAHDGLLAMAWYRDTKIYQVMLDASLKAAITPTGSIANAKLPAREAESILKSVLRDCDKIAWNEVDFLLTHGAVLADFNKFDSVLDFAFRCPGGFRILIKKNGLPLVNGGANGKGRADGTLIEYLRTENRYHYHTAEVVAALLEHHNDLKECADCAAMAFSLGLEADDPDIPKVMLKFGLDPNRRDSNGYAPFIAAVTRDRADVLDLLEKKVTLRINILDNEGVSALAWANCSKATKSAAWLKRHGAASVGYKTCMEIRKRQRQRQQSDAASK